MKAVGTVPDERHLQAAVLAYLSDMTLLDTSLYAHGTSVYDRSLQVASLDHAMWFHRPRKWTIGCSIPRTAPARTAPAE